MKPEFNVLYYDINKKKPCFYDVIAPLQDEFKRRKIKLKDMEYKDVKDFIEKYTIAHWQGRCEYEFCITSWPSGFGEAKLSIGDQVFANIHNVTQCFFQSLIH